MTDLDFSSIQPYSDKDIPTVMQRVASSPFFPFMVKVLSPKTNPDLLKMLFLNISTVDQFQKEIMLPFMLLLANKTYGNITSSGLENFEKGKPYLMVANHRDITLDAAMMNIVLLRHNIPTSEISFGDNLLTNSFVADLARVNKMFPIKRGGSKRDFYNNSLFQSHYIRHAICERGNSVWIAQRNGRTKDGNDHTEMGLIKMFSMSGTDDWVESMNQLNIMPVSVNYEYEPCDYLKTQERYLSQFGVYEKAKNEDMNSIFSGLSQYKGDVHYTFCKPITKEELEICNEKGRNERFSALAELIDQRIYSGYKLHKTNYIAFDLETASAQFEEYYSTDDLEHFIYYMRECTKKWPIEDAHDQLRDIIISMYAHPVRNMLGIVEVL